MGCPGENKRKDEPNRLNLISFWGLYLLCGIVTLGSLLFFFLRTVRDFVQYKRQQRKSSHPSSISSEARCSHVIYSFFDFIDEKEEAIKKIFTPSDNPQGQNS